MSLSIVLLGLLCVGLLFGLTSSEAQPQEEIRYDVPLYNQGSTQLCWAYCQIMVESYYDDKTLGHKDAAMSAKVLAIQENGEENWNDGDHPNNCYEHSIKLEGIDHLYQLLIDNGPIYARYCFEGEKIGHLIVVAGVDVTNGIVYTNNPWGIKGVQSYQGFCNGFVGGLWDYIRSGKRMTLDSVCIPSSEQ